MTGFAWSREDEAALRGCYAHWLNTTLAEIFGRPAKAIGLKARKMGLKKSPDLQAGQFARGHSTWNKGAKGSTGNHPNCRRTQFKPGQLSGTARHNYRPIDSELLDKDGNVLRKVSQTGVRHRDWRPVHVLVWEAAHGPVPAGHIVVFRLGMKTANVGAITAARLEVITRAENMRRNSYLTRYPKPVADLIRMRGVLNRKINNRSKRA
jgi:hypothetical protein